ncbi:phage portal protein [Paenibacillus sp. sptzw28]|uniref:phage portal protein n=1 Tax=Paenibacillus sp. sptzw28 TaxID=715179 RepID=UPI001C6E5CC3|nr:phage portal protein [Paenibacillus sp. sptzw28]QYR20809.1 phage portal protein [Paenibacillus sp. sptzw28]
MGLFDFLKPKNNRDDDLQKFLIGDDVLRLPAGSVTATMALKYTAVFACLRVLSETAASVPIVLYRKKEDGEREIRNDLGVADILRSQPNEEMSPFNFKEQLMMSLNLGGNSVSERLVDRRGSLVGLYPYQWQMVTIDRNPDTKKLQYKIGSSPRTVAKTLTRSQVFHVAGPSLDGVIGLSPISYASSAIRLGKSYEEFGVNLYRNGAFPSGAFSFEGVLSEPAFNRLKEDLGKNYTGMLNTGKPMLLEQNGKFTPYIINPADAQLIENKRFQIEDIARIYRVPLHLIQDLSRSTNNNIEHQSLEFVMYTMLPWFKRIEENMNMQLLTPAERRAGFYVEFKIDGLLRGDAKSRSESYALGRQWGWLSVNDIRRLENMPAIPNGDIYLEPLNMSEAGKPKPAGKSSDAKALADEIFKMITEREAV